MEAAVRQLYVFDDDEPHVVDVPELSFLTADPAGEAYAQTVTLEGLWSGDLADRSTWRWTYARIGRPTHAARRKPPD
jgi:hypothetical protein